MEHVAPIEVKPETGRTVPFEIGSPNKPVRILLVDDNPEALAAISRLLRNAGYEVLEAHTGTEGLQMARAQHPDLILLDVALPDINGIEVCKQIKSDPALAHIFVVHVSAVETSSESQTYGLDSGADGYIAMPMRYAEVLARVNAMVRIMKAERAVRESERLWRSVFSASNDILLLLDARYRILACNQKAVEAYGYTESDMSGKQVQEFFTPNTRSIVERRLASAIERDGAMFEAEQIRRQGTAFPVEVSCRSFVVGEEHQFILAIRDITGRKEAEARLRYYVSHDILTNLYNRVFFIDEMDRLRETGPFPVSIVVVDIDGLRSVNEQLGHAAGDELIVRASMVLRNAARSEDILARISGDEFAMLLPGSNAAVAARTVDRIREYVSDNNRNHSEGPCLNLSVGAATAKTGDMLVKALKKAEERMYEDKFTTPTRSL